MSSSSYSTMPTTASSFDERQWVIQIRKTLIEELEEDTHEIPVCIFSVPKTLMTSDPDSYTPHQVPIGPYHYQRPEMYEMERYKVAAARRMQQHLRNHMFEDHVVDQLTRYESRIRACYHKYLSCNGETLAWMMSMDACFMLEFLQIYVVENGKQLNTVSSSMSHLVDISGRKSAHNAILRDIVMLENQIPLFILRKMLEIKFSSLEIGDNLLFQMLMGFFNALSPFKMMEELPEIQVMECAHLLDFLYHLIAPKLDKKCRKSLKKAESGESNTGTERERPVPRSSSHVKQLLNEVWKILSKLNKGPLRIVKNIFTSKIVLLITKIPWTILSKIPGLNLLKGPLESLCFSQNQENHKAEDEDSKNNDDNPPLIEEIAIPSVSDLSKAYVNFVPTKGGILSIRFDEETCTFYLPTVILDENTRVVMKNLVAYEACNASGPVIFTRYTELMNGIIDTKEDVKLLREKGIILNRLKSDEEVAKLWNGMNRSVRLTKAPFLDKVIGDVNKFYNGRWKVKVGNSVKSYVYGSWQFLTLLACVILLLLMTLQAFCSVYSCQRLFNIDVLD